ncbi:MAG: response regulator [Gammaproteobacteria bacterium]
MLKKTVLVVDDDPGNIDLLVGMLKDRFTIKAARNGQIALKICSLPNPPNLVLLDIVMPEMDGYQVCRRLKTDASTAAIPVIFLSGEERVQADKHGASAFLTKPVDPDKLMLAIDNVLKTSED